MADTVTNTTILGVGLEYTKQDDGTKKTVYLKVPNPKTNLTETEIKSAIELLITDPISDKPILKTPDNQKFTGQDNIVTAYTEDIETIDFDIGITK